MFDDEKFAQAESVEQKSPELCSKIESRLAAKRSLCQRAGVFADPSAVIRNQFVRMDRTRERKFWIDFIRMYKARPALWNVKSTAYKDRSYKKLAYHELAERLRRLYPDADIDTVKRKINSIRACLRRVLVKIRASRKAIELSGGKVDEYKPTWWLFPHLEFLLSDDVPAVVEEEEEEEWEEEEESLPKKEPNEGADEMSSEDEESEAQQEHDQQNTCNDEAEM